MKILAIPNPFKESLSSIEAANAIKQGVLNIYPDAYVETIPIADGGDGTIDAFSMFDDSEIISQDVRDPLGKPISAKFLILKQQKTAVIEMALSSGLALVPIKKRNPMKTTTFGLGQLIKKALDYDVEKIIIGLGGSATVDGGIGMAKALGFSLENKLIKLTKIDTTSKDSRLNNIKIIGACDVDNPLLGKTGAVNIYAKQKGATKRQMRKLEQAMENYTNIVKRDLGIDVNNIAGAGAAGGLGAGLCAFLGAELKSGFDIISDFFNIENKIKESDIVITGEGKLDHQSFYGKVPGKVMQLCRKYNKPLICLAGIISDEIKAGDKETDNAACFSILNKLTTREHALKNAGQNIIFTIENIFQCIKKIEDRSS